VFLTQEYRARPTHVGALALYDVFCVTNAPARIQALEALPPRNLRLEAAMRSIREQVACLDTAEAENQAPTVSITTPHRNLFDLVAETIRNDPRGRFAQVCSRYDPALAPHENLPNGRMSAVQRSFLEKIWRPLARPRLVAAGFWQIANIE